jgi:hypothetical protein
MSIPGSIPEMTTATLCPASQAMRANLAFVEMLNRFGRTRGVTSAQVALAWLLAKKSWIVPIPGITKLAHLEENLRAADLQWSAGEMSEIEDAISRIEIVGEGRGGTPYGPTTIASARGELQPQEGDLVIARALGKRVAETAMKLRAK